MAVVIVPDLAPPVEVEQQGTIFDAASVAEVSSLWASGGSGELSLNCGSAQFLDEFCTVPPGGKVFDSPNAATIRTFTVYRGISCKAVGFSYDEALPKMEQSFRFFEARGVEAALAASFGPQAVDLTPAAGAVDIAQGMAMLLDYAAQNYGPAPTFFMSRGTAFLAMSKVRLELNGTRLTTVLGSPIVASAGFTGRIGPGGDLDGLSVEVTDQTGPVVTVTANPLDAGGDTEGEVYIYMMGSVALARTPVQINRGFGQANNDVVVLAERSYMAMIDCDFIVAVRVRQR